MDERKAIKLMIRLADETVKVRWNRVEASMLRSRSIRQKETSCRPLDQGRGVINSIRGEFLRTCARPGAGVSRVTGFRFANGSNGSIAGASGCAYFLPPAFFRARPSTDLGVRTGGFRCMVRRVV